MFATLTAIEYHLPAATLTNDELSAAFPDWSGNKIATKTGIVERRIAGPGECSSDLAEQAARKLFASGAATPDEIDFVLFCTQSPDYLLPTTACLLQDRLGLPSTVGALDFNLGCSGFVYGLSLAKGLIETGQAQTVLLLTGETYSKYLHPTDRTVRPIFGDAGAAALVRASPEASPAIGPFVFGTDGGGCDNLIVPAGGMRGPGRSRPNPDHLYMNGPEIFAFTLRTVPHAVAALVERSGVGLDEVDQFVFHQANRFMLEHLREKLKIPAEKFVYAMSHVGNTVSSTIPIALKEAVERHQIPAGKLVMLVGFGVGYSWAGTLVRSAMRPAAVRAAAA